MGLIFVGVALSAKLQENAVNRLRPLIIQQKRLQKGQVARAERCWANFLNVMKGGLLGD